MLIILLSPNSEEWLRTILYQLCKRETAAAFYATSIQTSAGGESLNHPNFKFFQMIPMLSMLSFSVELFLKMKKVTITAFACICLSSWRQFFKENIALVFLLNSENEALLYEDCDF